MSSVWKKEVNNVFAHHAYDYTCDCTYPGKQQKKSGIVLKEITEFHILSNLLVPPKLFITLNLTSRQKSSHSILLEILKENRSEKKSDTSQNAQ